MKNKKKLIRITTVPISLEKLLENQLQYVNKYYDITAISDDKPNLERVGKLQGIPVYHVEMTRKITPWQDLKSVWQLYKYFKNEKPFIVHTHTPKAGTVGMVAAKLAGVPHRLHTVAGLPLMEASGLKRIVLNLVEKLTYACTTRVYPNSKGLCDFIETNNFTSMDKLKVIANGSSNGINTDHFSPYQIIPSVQEDLKNELGVTEDDFVFVFVGRLVGDKGINELVGAFDRLSNFQSDIKLLLVGSVEADLDPLQNETIEIVTANPKIISVGFQKDVRPYFAISNALVFPSYREGFPNVVMQAGAMGLPAIVTDINGCNEIIIEGQNGTIIPVKNSVALQEAMLKMMTDKKFYGQLQSNARKMIMDRYEQKVVWDALLDQYKALEENV